VINVYTSTSCTACLWIIQSIETRFSSSVGR